VVDLPAPAMLLVLGRDRRPRRDEVEEVDGLVVLRRTLLHQRSRVSQTSPTRAASLHLNNPNVRASQTANMTATASAGARSSSQAMGLRPPGP